MPSNKLHFLQNILAMSAITLVTIIVSTDMFLAYENKQYKKITDSYSNLLVTEKPTSDNPNISVTPQPTQTENSTLLKTYSNNTCSFEVSYLADWNLKTNCYKDDYLKVDCLESQNFSGNIVVPNDEVKQGEALTFKCDVILNTNNQILSDCLSDKKKNVGVNLICQTVKLGSVDFINTELGVYKTIHNNNLLTVELLSNNMNELSPDINKILSTFKFTDQDSGEGDFCGGIAGVSCPEGYSCKLDGNYPDAGGTCIIN